VATRGRPITLRAVDAHNWRDGAALTVTPKQQEFVASVTYYLALCAYGSAPWQPWVVESEGRVVAFVMTAVDPADDSYWIGGLVVDTAEQGAGVGRAVVDELVQQARAEGRTSVALSYSPSNEVAKQLYRSVGFAETGETDDDEVVARLRLR
jgi:diamine N-acetyltransferase